jgi:hypothetical protein
MQAEKYDPQKTIRFPEDIIQAIENLRIEGNRSFSQQVIYLVRKGIELEEENKRIIQEHRQRERGSPGSGEEGRAANDV